MRIGFHMGELGAADVQVNRASNRTVYSGAAMQVAKAVSDAGRGGQITLSGEALRCLDPALLGGREMGGVVLHSGRHVLKEGGPGLDIYSLVGQALLPRLAYLQAPRSIQQRVGAGGNRGVEKRERMCACADNVETQAVRRGRDARRGARGVPREPKSSVAVQTWRRAVEPPEISHAPGPGL